jgi:hypothetical protein
VQPGWSGGQSGHGHECPCYEGRRMNPTLRPPGEVKDPAGSGTALLQFVEPPAGMSIAWRRIDMRRRVESTARRRLAGAHRGPLTRRGALASVRLAIATPSRGEVRAAAAPRRATAALFGAALALIGYRGVRGAVALFGYWGVPKEGSRRAKEGSSSPQEGDRCPREGDGCPKRGRRFPRGAAMRIPQPPATSLARPGPRARRRREVAPGVSEVERSTSLTESL